MTDDEINRKFDVVAELMASFAVKLDGLAERTRELAAAQRSAERRWERTEESIRALLAIAEIHEREITATNEKLNALVNTVERYISEGRNGKHDGP